MRPGERTILMPRDSRRDRPDRVRSVPTVQPRVGSELGPYRLCLELGRGGMATVFLARAAARAGLQRFVALKCIRAEMACDSKFVDMFFDEARIVSQIHHANVCSVLDFDEQGGVYYLAMEHLSGQPLTTVARELEKRPDRWEPLYQAGLICKMLADACEGLHAAHEVRGPSGELLNVVHRDVSPDNLFVTYDGNVKVVDFGVACASDQRHKTQTGVVKGKYSYLAPEILNGKKADRRADIWGLGVVAWELLTQQRLFHQESDVETLRAISTLEIPPPSTVRKGVPALLDSIVLSALQRDPSKRHQNARELGKLLLRFLVESRLFIGPAEVAEFVDELFPGGRACTRQLLDVAEQLDLSSAEIVPDASRSHDESSGSIPIVTGTVIDARSTAKAADQCRNRDDAPAPAPAPARHSSPGFRNRAATVATAAAGVVLGLAASAFWRSQPATAGQEPAPAAVVAPASPSLAVAPSEAGPTGYSIEVGPAASDGSGGLLLRLRPVVQPAQPAPAPPAPSVAELTPVK